MFLVNPLGMAQMHVCFYGHRPWDSEVSFIFEAGVLQNTLLLVTGWKGPTGNWGYGGENALPLVQPFFMQINELTHNSTFSVTFQNRTKLEVEVCVHLMEDTSK